MTRLPLWFFSIFVMIIISMVMALGLAFMAGVDWASVHYVGFVEFGVIATTFFIGVWVGQAVFDGRGAVSGQEYNRLYNERNNLLIKVDQLTRENAQFRSQMHADPVYKAGEPLRRTSSNRKPLYEPLPRQNGGYTEQDTETAPNRQFGNRSYPRTNGRKSGFPYV